MVSPFSQEQLKQMLAVCDLTTSQGQRDFTIISMLAETGIRVSELCRLRIQDIHDTSIRILDSKTNKEYDAEILPAASEQLQRYISHYRKPAESNDPYVFVNGEGRPLTLYDVSQLFKEIKKRAGLQSPVLSIHFLRLSFLSQLFHFKKS